MATIGERIAEIYRAEEAAGRKARSLEDVPGSYEAITPEWLTAVLCRDKPGAAVTACRVTDRSDGSSNRARIHLEYNDAGKGAGLPPTVFCKGSVTLKNRVLLGSVDAAGAEADFFLKVRGRLDIETPQPLHAAFDPRTYAYIIVMKDLGGQAEFCTWQTPISRAEASRQIDNLAKLHARFHESQELTTPTLPFKRWPKWWQDNLAGLPGFEEYCDVGFEAAQPLIPTSVYRRRAEIWPATMQSVQQHASLPHTLIHSDVHLGNWYKAANGAMGLTDWQVVSIGHWSRDFAYATTTSLAIEDRRNWHRDLLREYIERMAQYGVRGIDAEQSWLAIRRQLLHALAFWTITLRPTPGMPPMQPEATSCEFIKRITAAMEDYDALDAF